MLLVDHLHLQIGDSTGMAALVLWRDLRMFDYLCETGQRGKECTRLLVSDLTFLNLACDPAWPFIVSGAPLATAPHPIILESSISTKTRKTRHHGVLHLPANFDPRIGADMLLANLQGYDKA